MAEPVVAGRRAGVAARRRRTAAIVGAGVLLVVTSVAVTFTPVFGARVVRVEGNVVLAPDDVRTLAGVGEGTNVVHLDTERAEADLEANPWVLDASVTTDLPTTVVIEIVERSPVAVADGRVLSADGRELPGADEGGLPQVRSVAGTLDAGDRVAVSRAAGALAPGVRAAVAEILVEPDGDLTLLMSDGVTVVYGRPGDDLAKAEALRALLRWSREEQIALEMADVSVPAAPTARPVDGAEISLP